MKGIIAVVLFYMIIVGLYFAYVFIYTTMENLEFEKQERANEFRRDSLHQREFKCVVSKDSVLRNFQKHGNRLAPIVTFNNHYSWDSNSYYIQKLPLGKDTMLLEVKFIKSKPEAVFRVTRFGNEYYFKQDYSNKLPNYYSSLDSLLRKRNIVK
jgi:hypothetical protein